MLIEGIAGVPKFEVNEFWPKRAKYCLCIPIINENGRIQPELQRAVDNSIHKLVDIVLCDGNSSDGCTEHEMLKTLGVNTLLVKKDAGKQGAQLRMGFWWALQRGYDGIITIDGNNKDNIESITSFVDKLDAGFDFIQGSRFVCGGKAVNTPLIRYLSVRLIHAPFISLAARHWYSDTTNAFRAHSRRYLEHSEVQPFRNIFSGYELLAYLSVRASQLNLKVCEIPVERIYPISGKVPTKISLFHGNFQLIKILIGSLFGRYNP